MDSRAPRLGVQAPGLRDQNPDLAASGAAASQPNANDVAGYPAVDGRYGDVMGLFSPLDAMLADLKHAAAEVGELSAVPEAESRVPLAAKPDSDLVDQSTRTGTAQTRESHWN
mmetsp:Transcript_33385/g.76604  ORF Transcript_33385/g.76604 Transcript_33385/m.76604 type:complete len:113 (+) Transcript_33385:2-340(+)